MPLGYRGRALGTWTSGPRGSRGAAFGRSRAQGRDVLEDVAWGQSGPVALLQPRLAADAAPRLPPQTGRAGNSPSVALARTQLGLVLLLSGPSAAPPPGLSPPPAGLPGHTHPGGPHPLSRLQPSPTNCVTPNFTPGPVLAWTSVPRHVARPRTAPRLTLLRHSVAGRRRPPPVGPARVTQAVCLPGLWSVACPRSHDFCSVDSIPQIPLETVHPPPFLRPRRFRPSS